MNKLNRTSAFALGLFLSLGVNAPAQADDTEIFTVNASSGGASIQPNVLFILDTSGSMDGTLQTQEAYNPLQIYPGACSSARVYWRQGNVGVLPDCATSNRWFARANLRCNQAALSFGGTGSFIGQSAQYNSTTGVWGQLATTANGQNNDIVECQIDSGVHGDGTSATDLWATDSGPYTSNPALVISWATQDVYTMYDGNWMNWNASPPLVTRTRLQVVQEVTKNLLDSVSGVNVGLMRFSNNHSGGGGLPNETRAEGGMIIHAMEDVVSARAAMKTKIDALDHDGSTPLSESMYEAGLYYMGLPVDFGLTSRGNTQQLEPSVPASRILGNQALYDSPVKFSCQENYVILLTDGAPTRDTNANTKIQNLTNFNTLVGATCDGTGDGACLDDMAEYLYETDISPLPGRQFVNTYTIGFTIDLAILKETAESAGGQYNVASDSASLTAVLTQALLNILNQNTTFTAPTVAVNAFNRTQNLNDVFITVFESSGTEHWPGNLKKYRIFAGELTDDNTPRQIAVDPVTGFFTATARSFWSAGQDGAVVTLGGAANEIPVAASRNLYTYTGNYPVPLASRALTGGANAVADSNAALTDAMLNIGLPGDPPRTSLVDWTLGIDVLDENQNNSFTDMRNAMGDPLHASPASVIYGGTVATPDLDDAVIFSATNDGYLHAVDPVTGIELWSFIPQEKLGDLKDLYFDPQVANKHYGIDGNLRTMIVDVNKNGIVEPINGDRVYLYFGLRRGGSYYYGLDVTNKTQPELMWVKGTADLPGLGQTWSTPTPAKVEIFGASQNADNQVLIFGGGYDLTQDNTFYTPDIVGNAIYMIDAVSGNLLWWASNAAAADLILPAMNNAIPSDIRVLDMNGDGFADRMYAADLGGRVLRFDIYNNQSVANLVAGGAIASLGAANLVAPAPLADTRRFYYAPDTAIITNAGLPYLNIGIGSGYRAHPLETGVVDRFYALRDFDIFRQLTQIEYNALTPIVDSDPSLVDVTLDPNAVLPMGARGWQLTLTNPGEKVLAESRTFDNKLFFTTFEPTSLVNSCQPSSGTNRLYGVNAFNASPFTDLDGDGTPGELEDRTQPLLSGGIAPEVTFLFPSPDDPNCTGAACTPPPECLVGLEKCNAGFNNAPVRTFWNQQGAE